MLPTSSSPFEHDAAHVPPQIVRRGLLLPPEAVKLALVGSIAASTPSKQFLQALKAGKEAQAREMCDLLASELHGKLFHALFLLKFGYGALAAEDELKGYVDNVLAAPTPSKVGTSHSPALFCVVCCENAFTVHCFHQTSLPASKAAAVAHEGPCIHPLFFYARLECWRASKEGKKNSLVERRRAFDAAAAFRTYQEIAHEWGVGPDATTEMVRDGEDLSKGGEVSSTVDGDDDYDDLFPPPSVDSPEVGLDSSFCVLKYHPPVESLVAVSSFVVCAARQHGRMQKPNTTRSAVQASTL
jgi:hypothetical protein